MLFAIYKTIGAFMAPPGIFVTLIVIACVLSLKRPRKPLLFAYLCVLALLFYFLCIPLTTRWLLAPLENAAKPSLPKGSAVVVVLGGGQRRSIDATKLDPSPHSLVRLIEALELSAKFNWPIIVCGGSYSGEVPEAVAMANKARRLFPNLTIYKEAQSRTTWENIKNVLPILKSLGVNDVVLVTHGYHMFRALMTAKGMAPKINWYPYPVGEFKELVPLSLMDFLPKASDFQINSIALREYLGIVAYKAKLLLGRI